jgi:hypothetical protein
MLFIICFLFLHGFWINSDPAFQSAKLSSSDAELKEREKIRETYLEKKAKFLFRQRTQSAAILKRHRFPE